MTRRVDIQAHPHGIEMLRALFCFLVLFFSFQTVWPCAAKAARILVVHSYNQGLAWTDGVQNGISNIFFTSDQNHELDIHYLDLARLSSDADKAWAEENFIRHMSNVPHRHPYDLILLSDNDALRIMLKYRDRIAPNVPIVFCGVNNFSHSMIAGQTEVTGIAETPSCDRTLELVRILKPKVRKILVLTENTTSGRQNMEILHHQLSNVSPGLEYEYVMDTNIISLETRLSQLTSEWAVLPMCRPFEGDRLLSASEATSRLSSAAPVPVFASWDFWIGHGPVGGVVVSSEAHGETAARIGLRILGGEKASSIPVLQESPNVLLLDQNALNRFNIPDRLIPANAKILHHIPSFYEQYLALVWTYGSISLLGIILCLLLVINVVRRKRAEGSLKRQLIFTETLLQALPIPVFYKDNTGRYLGCNQAFADLLGTDTSEIIGQTAAEIFPQNQAAIFDSKDKEIQSSTDVQIYEHRMPTAHDHLHIIVHKALFFDENAKPIGIVGAIADITARKALEQELINARDHALAASKSKSEFLANMSHEIRTPLNGIMGMLQLLETSVVDTDERDYCVLAIQSAERLHCLLSNILDLSRIEAEKMHIRAEEFQLRAVLQQTIELFMPSAVQTGITLKLTLDQKLPHQLIGDPLRLQQVLTNLLGNAFKFTQTGSITVEAYLLGYGKQGGPRVFFSVTDTGCGIADEALGALFQPFTQVSQGYTRNHQGAGLGLTISRQLVKLMGGTMVVESEVGIGTSFHFCITFAPLPKEQRAKPQETTDHSAQKTGRVLLAEDDEVSRFAIRRMLEHLGNTVITAQNGEEALSLLEQHYFDVILMDVQMPVMNGIEATRRIRTFESLGKKKRLPIIALTAYAMPGDREQFLQAGMDAYLPKPVTMDQLRATLAEYIS